jgi:ECF transporter S component (folate family)
MKFGKGRFLFMQEKQKKARHAPYTIAVFGNPRALCLAALLAAMSLILGKFLQIPNPFSEFVRISFENLPVILAGIVLGPLAGAMTGAVADLVGCLAYGYSINPLITLGAAAVGLVAGLCGFLLARTPLLCRLSLSAVAAHLVGSVLVKTAGVAAWYLSKYEIGYLELTLWRLLNYSIIAVLEIAVLYALLRHRGFQKQLERMCRK